MVRNPTRVARSVRLESASICALLLTLGMLLGCTPQLPSCVSKAETGSGNDLKLSKNTAKVTSQVLIGIDGSGSMLGHLEATDPSRWRNLLQAVNLSASTQGLSSKVFRIGGAKAQDLGSGSVTEAVDPCFFKGCGKYPSVASGLQTLWDVQPEIGSTPLRLLVSDLEVNQSDISSLVGGIRKDLLRGASAGILALRLPFNGKVFNSEGVNFYTGKLNRPLYLLATGKTDQVRSLLSEIKKNMAQKGVTTQEISMLDDQSGSQTLKVKSASVVPINKGTSGNPVRLENANFSPGNNSDYGFVRLKPGATGIVIATVVPWSGGTTRPDIGLVRLERIPVTPNGSSDPEGVRLRSMSVAGTNVRLEIDISSSAPSGLLRATIPRGSLPEQWWLDWDRSEPMNSGSKEKTEGLLLLLTTLSEQIASRNSTTPAAELCVAYQHT